MKKFLSLFHIFKNKKIIAILIMAVIYSIILGLFGIFGVTVKNALVLFFVKVMPIIGIIFGYFLCIFLPFRIAEALRVRKEKEIEEEKEDKIQKHINAKKALEQKILETLSKEETTR